MKLLCWLQYLFDQLIDSFRSKRGIEKAEEYFIKELMYLLQELWQDKIVTVLVESFGYVSTLYIIFYAEYESGETIMEIWDPNYYDSKPSQVFKLKSAPQNSPFSTERNEAKVLTLKNWY